MGKTKSRTAAEPAWFLPELLPNLSVLVADLAERSPDLQPPEQRDQVPQPKVLRGRKTSASNRGRQAKRLGSRWKEGLGSVRREGHRGKRQGMVSARQMGGGKSVKKRGLGLVTAGRRGTELRQVPWNRKQAVEKGDSIFWRRRTRRPSPTSRAAVSDPILAAAKTWQVVAVTGSPSAGA